MKTAVRIVGAALVSILLLAVLLAAALQIYLDTDRGKARVLGTVNSLIPGRVLAADLSVSLPGRSVSLIDAKLLGPEGETVLRLGRARAEVAFLPLVRNTLVFRLISLEEPELRLDRRDAGARLNLLKALLEEKPGLKDERGEDREEGLAVVIERLFIHDGRLRYDDPASDIRAGLDGVNARGGLDTGRMDAEVSLSAARVFLRSVGHDLVLTGVAAGGAYRDERLDPLFLAASYRGFRASVRGSVEHLGQEPAADLEVEYGGELSDLVSLLKVQGAYSGTISGGATLKGTVRNPRARMSLRCEKGILQDVRVESAELEAELQDRVVELKDSLVKIASGRAVAAGTLDLRGVFPDGFGQGSPDLDAASYTLSLIATDIDPSAVITTGAALPKQVSGQVEISGTGVLFPKISARSSYVLNVSGIPGEWPVSPGDVDLRGEAGLDYPSLTYALTGSGTGGMDVDLRGSLDLEARAVQAQADLDIRRVQAVAPVLEGDVRGSVSARTMISGTLDRPMASGTIRGGNLTWREYRVGDVHADLRLDDTGVLSLTGFDLNRAGDALLVAGKVKVLRGGLTPDPDLPADIRADFKSARIDRIVSHEGMGGVLDGGIRLSGNLLAPRLKVDLAAREVTFQGTALGEITVTGAIDPEGKGRKPAAQEAGFDPRLRLDISGRGLDLHALNPLAKGTLRYDARVAGSLRDPRGTFRASVTDPALAGQELDRLTAEGGIEGRKVFVHPLTAVVAQGQVIAGSGSLDLGGARRYEAELSTRGIDLRSLAVFRKSPVTGGELVFEISGRGTLEDPRASGTVRVLEPSVKGRVLEDLAAGFELAGGIVRFDGAGDLSFCGTYDLKRRVVDMEALFEGAELAPYFAMAGRPELRGVLSGSAEIAGEVTDPAGLSVNVHVARADLSFREKPVLSTRNLTAEYEQGSLFIPESRIVLPSGGGMTLSSSRAPRGELDLVARGRVPLEVLALFEADLADLRGAASFEITAAGRILSPRIEGEAIIEDVRYPIAYNDQLLHDTSGHIRFDGRSIIVEKLTGRLDDGSFEARGRVGLEALTPGRIDLTLRARSLPVVIPDAMDLVVDGDALLNGLPDRSLLQADVAILDAVYYRDHQLNLVAEVGQRILGGGRRGTGSAGPMDLPYLRAMELDVSIIRRGPVLVENNLADLSLDPDLQVRGTLDNPVLTGRVEVTEGVVTYQRRDFEVVRGVLEFTDPYRTRAEVDLEASGQVRDWMITLLVTGPLDNLNIAFESDPPEEDGVLLSLLATGRTPDELTGVGALGPRSPTSMLAELLAGTYGEELRETTGLDILELETAVAGEGAGAGDIRITVGEELTRRLTVKYAIETRSGDTIRTAIAEYRLLENLLVNGFQDNRGTFGGDLQFRLEFR